MTSSLRTRFVYCGLALSFGILASSPVLATDTADLNVNATVMIPLTLDCPTALSFGSIDVRSGAGEITLAPDGTFTAGSQFTLPDAPAQAGICSIDGEDSEVVNITMVSNDIVHQTDATQKFLIDELSLTGPGVTDAGGGDYTVTLQNGGAQNFNVGAKLYFEGDEIPGYYSGDVTITVDYQ